LHLSRFLVNDPSDFLEYLVRSATIRNHLGVKEKTAIFIFGVQSSKNFHVRLYADEFTGLQIKSRGRCGLSYRYRS